LQNAFQTFSNSVLQKALYGIVPIGINFWIEGAYKSAGIYAREIPSGIGFSRDKNRRRAAAIIEKR